MKSQAFLLFKDRLVEYLRNFVRSLQLNVGTIEEILEGLGEDQVETVLEKAWNTICPFPGWIWKK